MINLNHLQQSGTRTGGAAIFISCKTVNGITVICQRGKVFLTIIFVIKLLQLKTFPTFALLNNQIAAADKLYKPQIL